MIEPLRSAFNAAWTERAYEVYKERLAESAGSQIGFRVCESPVFLPPGPARRDGARGARDLGPAPAARGARALEGGGAPGVRRPGERRPPALRPGGLRDRRGGRPPRAPAHRAAGLPVALRLPAPPGAPVPGDGARATGSRSSSSSAASTTSATDAWWGTRSWAAFPPRTWSSSTSTRRGRAPTRTSRPPRSSSGSAPSARPTSRRAGASCGTSGTGRRPASSASTTA